MARRDNFDLSHYEADLLADMVDTMVEQLEAMEDLWDDVIGIINKYPSGAGNDTLVTERSGIMTSTRQIVNRILATSGRYTSPVTTGLDGSDGVFSAREHGDDDVSDNNSTENEDEHYIDGFGHAGTMAANVGMVRCWGCGARGDKTHNKEELQTFRQGGLRG